MNQSRIRVAAYAAAFAVAGLAAGHASAEVKSLAASPPKCDTPTTPFCDALMPPIAGWKGNVFKLSQNYPTSTPSEDIPWKKFDPIKEPLEYLKSVLGYFYDGNVRDGVEASFDPALNKIRMWYNAPWQDFGTNGREFVHGLTRERVSNPGELAPEQKSKWNNYAVGFYNAPGGMVIGQVWKNHGKPDPSFARLPDGTVAAKLLYTTASVDEVPYLKGSPEWDAYVYADPHDPSPKPDTPRKVLKVRLLQIDIAVRDSRVNATTGWVFGTFVYGGGPGGPAGEGWKNVAPIGVMWGNDPGYSGSGGLKETVLNEKVKMPHVGYQGRLNGPVDNPASSCTSCHSTAEVPAGSMFPPNGGDVARWFRNIKSGEPFDAGRQSLDYSLQLSVGLVNFGLQNRIRTAKSLNARQGLIQHILMLEADPPRDGGPLE